jgi:hypothetical protein
MTLQPEGNGWSPMVSRLTGTSHSQRGGLFRRDLQRKCFKCFSTRHLVASCHSSPLASCARSWTSILHVIMCSALRMETMPQPEVLPVARKMVWRHVSSPTPLVMFAGDEEWQPMGGSLWSTKATRVHMQRMTDGTMNEEKKLYGGLSMLLLCPREATTPWLFVRSCGMGHRSFRQYCSM